MKRFVVILAVAAATAVSAGSAVAAAPSCDPLDTRDCLLPWPSNHFTKKDAHTATGLRVDLSAALMPKNASGVPAFPPDINHSDGFGPGSGMLTYVDGIDLARTGAVPITNIAAYTAKQAPIVVIDAKTGKRQMIWVELDSNPDSEANGNGLVMIHPARNLPEGRRYIVALRNLKDSAGATIPAGAAFASLRDGKPAAGLAGRAKEYASIFASLKKAKVDRKSLYLAWDFTVASESNLTERSLSMRNESFAALGDKTMADGKVQGRSPQFSIDSVTNYTAEENANTARRVEGTLTVPCYLNKPNCAPGGTFIYKKQKGKRTAWLPSQQGTMAAKFYCSIPRSALTDPARPVVYGHGLLGNPRESFGESNQLISQSFNILFCATREIGMADEDVVNAVGLLRNMARFASFPDRLQQGMLNGLLLGRAMINPNGFVANAAFKNDAGRPLINTSKLFYNGNSQGGVQGAAITALAPDFKRAVFGVPGINYSLLLPRSVDFDEFEIFFKPAYPNRVTRMLILNVIQNLWDRGEGNGYALHATDDPLPNTPRHQVLLEAVVGDHQVAQIAAQNLARTVNAVGRRPGSDPGRSYDATPFYGIRSKGKPSDSRYVLFDSGPIRPGLSREIGTNVPPVGNVPPRLGQDPHGLFDLERGRQASAFFNGSFLDVCPAGRACRLDGWAY
ncbi:MAG: hypothetical protein F2813_04950 [Actinobacteria bacterium]|uniref:Unannotated protein n=1 Tax=freshwater metagenome TaxID=449393 RepID=A0A6J5ZQA1_9ZZZZ|nr:hypothetical protein [Actinomycetota bacterium]